MKRIKKYFFILSVALFPAIILILYVPAINQIFFHWMVNISIQEENSMVFVEETDSNKDVFLDTRTKEEYETSHIPGAIWIGENGKEHEFPNNEQRIIVYCSIGVRSEKVVTRLKNEGIDNVYNLYGGIFEWHNLGNEVANKEGTTTKIHSYSWFWGLWIIRR